MFNKAFLTAVAERATKTFVQVIAAASGGSVINLIHLAWASELKLALGAALMSVLTSISSAKVSKTGGPSLVGEVIGAIEPIIQTTYTSSGTPTSAPQTLTVETKTVKTPKAPKK